MPSYGQTVTLQYLAWDTMNNVGKTGDAANHALRWVHDGTEDTTTIPTASEVDAASCPGVYKATVTAAQAQCQVGTLAGRSSTAGIVILPITVTFENLPTAAPAAAGGLLTVGTGSGQISPSAGAVPVSGTVTVGTNNDKTGYSLAASQAFSTTGSVGSVTGAVGSVTGNVGGNVAGGVASVTAGVTVTTNNDKTGYSLNLTQSIPTSNTAQTVGDALNAARAQGFGRWVLSGTTLTLYAGDGATVVRSFTLDSASTPTQRS